MKCVQSGSGKLDFLKPTPLNKHLLTQRAAGCVIVEKSNQPEKDEGAYIIDVFIVISNVIKLDLIVVSRPEGVCLVDFGCEEEEGKCERKKAATSISSMKYQLFCIIKTAVFAVTMW